MNLMRESSFSSIKASLSIGILLIALTTTAGCGDSSENKAADQVAQQAGAEIANLGKAAKDAGGNYDKLPQAMKDKFLERVAGNEAQAKDMVTRMAGGGGTRGPGGTK